MCELDINECAGSDRVCGAYVCTNLPGDYKCDCDFFHSGKRCEKGKKNKFFIVIMIPMFDTIFVLSQCDWNICGGDFIDWHSSHSSFLNSICYSNVSRVSSFTTINKV